MNINLEHKELSCRECYAEVKKLHKAHASFTLTPSKWLKLHLESHEVCALRLTPHSPKFFRT